MATEIREGTLLWEPPEELKRASNLFRYMEWLDSAYHVSVAGYPELWRWSVEYIEAFWGSIWDYFDVRAERVYETVLPERVMPGADWFPGARLNYSEQVFRQAGHDRPALIFQSELRPRTDVSWAALERDVAAVAAGLRALGVRRGDRVVAYLPNIPEAVIAFLAAASLGAIWSSCSPDFGTGSVIERFRQIEPKVLFAVDGYSYNGKAVDRRATVAEIQQALPTIERTVLVSYLDPAATPGPAAMLWSDLLRPGEPLRYEPVPFSHPLWVLYSSGTTGLPKPIVHGHGGIVLEHLKVLSLHLDLKPGDRFFWFTTTGWMMWNFLAGGLLVGATSLLYDGSPAYPDMDVLWRFAADTGMTCFGTSAAYLTACMKAGIEPGRAHDLSALKSVGSTGSPLPPEGFQWVYQHVKPDVWLGSASGGTDVCTAFIAGCPLLPVYAGELQCRCLGAAIEAFDEAGHPVYDEVGELVVTQPMPCMPVSFWNDPGDQRYRESYFEQYPGVWRHGDWIKITRHEGVVIYGRSDSTLNRQGVRIGTSEIYGAVEELPEIADSLIIGLEQPGGGYYLPLFVVLRPGHELDDALRERIAGAIRTRTSPRHVPDEIIAIPAVPRTLNGKKLEVPVKKLLLGMPAEKSVNSDGMSNPESLEFFFEFARTRLGVPVT